jgi:hypothetical protein
VGSARTKNIDEAWCGGRSASVTAITTSRSAAEPLEVYHFVAS